MNANVSAVDGSISGGHTIEEVLENVVESLDLVPSAEIGGGVEVLDDRNVETLAR